MLFNSLGSNYDFNFIIRSLFSLGTRRDGKLLKKILADKYGGEVILLYKNREAIKLVLTLLNLPKGSKVGINGFTCYVVYQAIKEVGLIPEYLDIEKEGLNFSIETLKKAKKLKAIIVQNTLGHPCNIEEIADYCRENNIFLIEDLAHSAGIKYKKGKEAGMMGDFTALSFSQDKIIDTVSGGALIIRNKKYQNLNRNYKFLDLNLTTKLRDRFYPFLTFLIRKTYVFGFGKLLHFILKNLGVLSQPMGNKKNIVFHNLPDSYCNLILYQLKRFNDVLKHRDEIVNVYSGKIDRNFRIPFQGKIRFPILVKKRDAFIEYLAKNGIYLSDIWYDAPVAPKKYLKLTNYSGECPQSEEVSQRIVNLPTHINISNREAEKISEKINTWLKS